MESDHGSVGVESARFARTLDTLKREGSNVLIVGANACDAHDAVCRRLCGPGGSSAEGGRYHLFVTDHTGGSDGRTSPTDADGSGETVERIAYAESGAESTEGDRPSLETLGSDIIDTIADLDAAADGLDPSELRVCMGSLVTLFQDHDAERVFRLLHITTSGVEHVNGMGHYHLALDRDHEAVSLLEPLFDAVVELRSDEDGHEQRWHLRDQGTTDWIPI